MKQLNFTGSLTSKSFHLLIILEFPKILIKHVLWVLEILQSIYLLILWKGICLLIFPLLWRICAHFLVVSVLFLLMTKSKHLKILQSYLSCVTFASILFSLLSLLFIFYLWFYSILFFDKVKVFFLFYSVKF